MAANSFVAIDVETANPDISSICQIGVARFEGGQLVDEWCSLVDPEDYFDDVNVAIHGITRSKVRGQPKLPAIADRLRSSLQGNVSVCHTHFDRVAVARAFAKYNLPPVETTWLDSARVSRRTWECCAWWGYGLANVCELIGYSFQHHDALEDAKAAGRVLLAAIEKSGSGVDEWLKRVSWPIGADHAASGRDIARDGDPQGDLYGEVVVFTGSLAIPRAEAADMASAVGCTVAPGVTKKTTLLVVGDQDITKLAGHEKSSKHRKAEQLVADGQRIRIIREADFRSIVLSALPPTAAADVSANAAKLGIPRPAPMPTPEPTERRSAIFTVGISAEDVLAHLQRLPAKASTGEGR